MSLGLADSAFSRVIQKPVWSPPWLEHENRKDEKGKDEKRHEGQHQHID
jgi:hypothetical protein